MAFLNAFFTYEADRAVFNEIFFPAFCHLPKNKIWQMINVKKLKTRGLTAPKQPFLAFLKAYSYI